MPGLNQSYFTTFKKTQGKKTLKTSEKNFPKTWGQPENTIKDRKFMFVTKMSKKSENAIIQFINFSL